MELNSRLIAAIDRSRSTAIDGLRHPIDFGCLSSSFGTSFHLIFLEAEPETRFNRLRMRFGQFSRFQAADSHAVEARIEDLRPLASTTIRNDEPLEDLYHRLDDWIYSCGAEERT
jgi:dephospho-CoA kinase